MTLNRRHIKLAVIFAVAALIVGSGAILFASLLYRVRVVTVKGKDMEPTIYDGSYVLVTESVENLRRGDIVVFRNPANPAQSFVKRIVGLPEERVQIRSGTVYIEDKALEETYVDQRRNRYPMHTKSEHIPSGSYYVLGDNRDASNDSRLWGPLSHEFIDGRVLFK
jgi:signal peptidase I